MIEVNYINRYKFLNNLYALPVFGIKKLTRLLSKVIIPRAKGKLIIQSIYGFKIKVDPVHDSSVQREIFTWGTYETGTLDWLRSYVKNANVIFDIGANIGFYSLFFNEYCKQTAEIFAFEPNPITIEKLSENLDLNAAKKVEIIPFGLSDEEKELDFFVGDNLGEGTFVNGNHKKQKLSKALKLTTLDLLWKQGKIPSPDIIKIDIEGLELPALKGAIDLLANASKLVLVVECNNASEEDKLKSIELFRFLKQECGFSVFVNKYGKNVPSSTIEIKDETLLPKYDNLLCLKGY